MWWKRSNKSKEAGEPLLGDQACGTQGFLAKWEKMRAPLKEFNLRNLVVMAVLFGLLCGLLSLSFAFTLDLVLKGVWESLPNKVIHPLLEKMHKNAGFPPPEDVAWVYIMIAAVLFASGNGVSRRLLGYPGDMPHTIKMVHEYGSLPIQEVLPMLGCSFCTVTSGSSLGPEAPLLAICASVISWVSKNVFGHSGRMLRACTLMGMAAGLSAFFGVSFGGAIFAYEVLHTSGLQFYESLTYSVLSSVICLAVQRGLWSLHEFGTVWIFDDLMEHSDTRHIFVGIVLGFVGVGLTHLYVKVFKCLKYVWEELGANESKRPIWAGMLGGITFGLIGVFLPPTMFWGEFEMKTIADPTVELAHVWPSSGFYGFQKFMNGEYSMWLWFGIGFAKIVTIAISSVSGLRGGFIFPLMLSGACIGRGLAAIPNIPWWSSEVPSSLPAIVLAGALTTGITRTPFACTLILTALGGIPAATSPTLIACLIVFYATMSCPFIKTQRNRDDIEFKHLEFPEEDHDSSKVEGKEEEKVETLPVWEDKIIDSVDIAQEQGGSSPSSSSQQIPEAYADSSFGEKSMGGVTQVDPQGIGSLEEEIPQHNKV